MLLVVRRLGAAFGRVQALPNAKESFWSDAAAEVQDPCAARFRKGLNRSASSERPNQTVADQQGAVLDDAEVGQRRAAPRVAAAERQEL